MRQQDTHKKHYTVYNDDGFYETITKAKSGDVIYIYGSVVIDLADWILPGDMVDFMNSKDIKRKPLCFTVPAGVTLMGIRGIANSTGAVLKTTSYVDMMITLEAGARISGLTLQGCDTPDNANNETINHSIGIAIKGDNAVVDNCEISGFYRYGITVADAKNVQIHHNYIHHIAGRDSGFAIKLDNATADIHHNVFSRCTRLVSAAGKDTAFTFKNNLDAGNNQGQYFQFVALADYDSEYTKTRGSIASAVIENNTLLSAVDLMVLKGLPGKVIVKNNLFGYADNCYDLGLNSLANIDGSVLNNRIQYSQNAYNMLAPYVVSKSAGAPATHTDTCLGAYGVKESVKLTPPVLKETKAPKISYSQIIRPSILSSSFQTDANDSPYMMLDYLAKSYKDKGDKGIAEGIAKTLQSIITEIGSYSNYYTYENSISIVKNDEIYGVIPSKDPPGGGVGYSKILHFEKESEGVIFATDYNSFMAAISNAREGDIIYIPSGTVIDMGNANIGTITTVTPQQGVILASDRGYVREDGSISTGGVIKTTQVSIDCIIYLSNPNVRITGLVVEGPDPAQHLALWDRCFVGKTSGAGHQPGHNYLSFASPSTGISIASDNIEIDNCELSGFSSSAIAVSATGSSGAASRGANIHHCYIHHNQMKALGYGVCFGKGYGTISYCMFNYNRHSIAGTGNPSSGYEAFCNVEMGNTLSDHFDMHGGEDRRDGTQIAGEYVDIHHNTFLSTRNPYNNRGYPTDHRTFSYNIHLNTREFFDTYLSVNRYTSQPLTNLTIGKNLWNLSSGKAEIKTG